MLKSTQASLPSSMDQTFLDRGDSCGRINWGLSGQASCGPLVNVSMPSGELASTDPTTRTQDARFQERGIRAKVPLSACSSLQHLQRPTPSHLSQNAPNLPGIGDEDVAHGGRGRLKIHKTRVSRVQQRDNAPKMVAIEVTGGFEAVVAAGLTGAGLPVLVVNPAQGARLRPGAWQTGQDRSN
jgi:hypothetical protein